MSLVAPEKQFTPPNRPKFLDRPVARPQIALPRQRVTARTAPVAVRAASTDPAIATAPSFSTMSGLVQALPIISGYLPVAFALGVLCAGAGLSFAATSLMSVIVFAGSAQFVAVSLLSAAAPLWTIVLTTFIINFRHFLMSTAIAPKLKHWSRRHRILFGLQMTDESFALLMSQYAQKDPGQPHTFAVNVAGHSAWILGTVLGFQASKLLPDLKSIGMDFALTGMFISLVVLQLKDRQIALAGALAAISALALKLIGAGHLAVLTAAIVGASVATLVEEKIAAVPAVNEKGTSPA